MSRRRRLFAAIFFLGASVEAQQYPSLERGFKPDKLYQFGELDSVNTMNGNLGVRIPIGPAYPVGGSLSYGLSLVYNSKAWDFQEATYQGSIYSQAVPNRLSDAGMGWSLGFPRLLDPSEPINDYRPGQWVYISEDGAEHVFYQGLHTTGQIGTDYCTSVCYTRDGSYVRMSTSGIQKIVELPDGTRQFFLKYTWSDGTSEWRLAEIRDRFEDFSIDVSVSYSSDGNIWTITDKHGRQQTIIFGSDPAGRYRRLLQSVTLTAFANQSATYSFLYYSPQSVSVPCGSTLPFWTSVGVSLLSDVVLPDASRYSLAYYTPNSPSTCHAPALLSDLTLPTLGKLRYIYRAHTLPIKGCSYQSWFKDTAGVGTRQFLDAAGNVLGTWTYTSLLSQPPTPPQSYLCDNNKPFSPPPEEVQVAVTSPLLDKTVHFFSVWPGAEFPVPSSFDERDYGLPFSKLQTDGTGTRFVSTQVSNCDSGGGSCALARSEYVRYERDADSVCSFTSGPTPDCLNTNRRLVSQRTVYNDDNNAYADVNQSNFDDFGHYRTVATDGNFGGGNQRTTFTNYNEGNVLPGSAWVLGTFKEQTVTEGGSTAKAEFCFDANSGFLLRRRTLKNPGVTEHQNDVLAVYSPDAAGNVQSEQYFGGDTQIITANNTTCTMALPAPKYRLDHTYQYGTRATSQYSGTTFFSLEQTIDARTGLPSQSKDVSGIAFDYEYDQLGRLTWVKPEVGNNDGWTEYVYTRATAPTVLANVLVRRRNNGSKTATVLAQNQIFFDALGRVWQEKQLLPAGGFNVRETLYDGAGNKASVSEATTGTPNKKTQFLNYDPFGRATTIRPPDGAAHDVTLSYQGVRVVDRTVKIATSGTESAATTTETYDRQGRLLSVKEPSGPGDALVTTTYSYDIGNRLRQVQTTGSGATQNRFFTYDNRGFLTSETHPEKGVSGNGTVNYSNYDARGHAGRKTDGPNDLNFFYDSAERLKEVWEASGQQRLLKSFAYSAANGNAGCTDYSKAKIKQQSRFNYVKIGTTDIIVELREWMTYCGRQGRLSRRTLENWVANPATNPPGLFETFSLPNLAYDALGNLASLDYPRCTHAECTTFPNAPSPRTVTSSYTNGFLTSVGIPANAGYYASSITYHPNLMVNQVIHGNNVIDTYAIDPSSMRRPGSITATTAAGATLWSTGAYGFDGAANVKTIGTHTFTYDKVNRLKSANLYLEPTSSMTLRTQTYTYDSFGNLQSIAGNNGRETPTSSATNRLTAGAYDAAGNLTSWNFNSYQFDPFNLMWDYRTGSDEWLYLYTADDERAWSYKTDNTSLWTLRGPDGKVLREYTSGGTWAVNADYIYRDSSLLAVETPQGARHFSLDHLGTPRLVTASGSGGGVGASFYTLTPCRVLDTRTTSTPLLAGETRTVQMAGLCGIPAGASAVSVNLTVTQVSAQGELTAYPANEAQPLASAISYRLGLDRANNAVLKLGGGALKFFANHPSGSLHLLIDVNGYFLPPPGASNVVAYHVYYPFGEEATAFDQDTIRAKFTGHERDLGNLNGTGDDLDYMHARHCSPLTGRFQSMDPALASADPRLPQSWGRYTYVRDSPLKYIDPTGEVLVLDGNRAGLNQVEQVANDELVGFDLEIDSNGNTTLVPNNETGPESPQQAAFRNTLTNAINSGDTIKLHVVSGNARSSVMFGQFTTGRLDIGDIAGVGNGRGVTSSALLAHEVAEQTAKQTQGIQSTEAGHSRVHPIAVAANEAVSGYRLISQTINISPAGNGTITSTRRQGNQTVTVTFHWVNGNLVRVTRRP